MSREKTSLVGPRSNGNQSSLPIKEPSEFQIGVARLIAAGKRPAEIAKLLEPEDKAARKRIRRKIWYMVRNEPIIMADLVASEAKVEMVMGLGPATHALTRRAAKGRPDAIKLLYEASGFHNPRVKHEHSGDIKITLDSMPRPARVVDEDDVVDAEVVDE